MPPLSSPISSPAPSLLHPVQPQSSTDNESSPDCVVQDILTSDVFSPNIHALTNLQLGVTILLQRLKQQISCGKELASFFRKRSSLEDEYARGLQKLFKATAENIKKPELKRGTFAQQLAHSMTIHDKLVENSAFFVNSLRKMSDELADVCKVSEKNRKEIKEASARNDKSVHEAEAQVEKAKAKFDSVCDEYDRTLAVKSGSSDPKKPLLSFRSRNEAQLLKMEEDTRARAQSSDTEYKEKIQLANLSLKGQIFEFDAALSCHLSRYAVLSELLVYNNGIAIKPLDEDQSNYGLKECLNLIRNEDDFREFVRSFAAKVPKEKPREEILYEANAACCYMLLSNVKAFQRSVNPYFGISLDQVIARDGSQIPTILVKCSKAVEEYGMTIEGIYRLSGSSTSMNKLKQAFDFDPRTVNLSSYTAVEDVNSVASLLKQFFRELPDPLLTKALYRDFIEAAKLPDDIRRRDTVHSLINRLNDNHYSTLRALVFHLDRVARHEHTNRMPLSNLAIVWAPNLMNSGDFSAAVGDSAWQNKVIETILINCRGIFDEE